MNKQLFRKTSLDKVSSPEQLNDYVKVSNPGVWMLMSAVIILLVGVCIWGFFGHLDTKIITAGTIENGTFTGYIHENDITSIKTDMAVKIGESEYSITNISASPIVVSEELNSYVKHLGNLQDGEWVYTFEVSDVVEKDGVTKASVTTESVSPMSFIMN